MIKVYTKCLKRFPCVKDAKIWFTFLILWGMITSKGYRKPKNTHYCHRVKESSSCDSNRLNELILAIIEFLCFSLISLPGDTWELQTLFQSPIRYHYEILFPGVLKSNCQSVCYSKPSFRLILMALHGGEKQKKYVPSLSRRFLNKLPVPQKKSQKDCLLL